MQHKHCYLSNTCVELFNNVFCCDNERLKRQEAEDKILLLQKKIEFNDKIHEQVSNTLNVLILTIFILTDFILTDFILTHFILTNFFLTNFILTNCVYEGVVISNFNSF